MLVLLERVFTEEGGAVRLQQITQQGLLLREIPAKACSRQQLSVRAMCSPAANVAAKATAVIEPATANGEARMVFAYTPPVVLKKVRTCN